MTDSTRPIATTAQPNTAAITPAAITPAAITPAAITPAALLGKLRVQLGAQSFYGLPRTDGTFASVLWESFRQEGVFMAPFTAHAEHPLAPFSRWMLLTFSLCTTIALNAGISFSIEQGDQSCHHSLKLRALGISYSVRLVWQVQR